MRDIHELLKLVLHKLNASELSTGLCYLIKSMRKYNEIITLEEQNILLDYLTKCSPKERDGIGFYWYECGVKTYRTRYLNKHIKLTK